LNIHHPATFLLLALAALGLGVSRTTSFRDEQWKFPRVRTAAREKDEVLKQLFAGKRLKYPPDKILLRAFKKEGVLELWVQNSPGAAYDLVKSYSICATSGILGPKRRFGDEQVPEGFYELDWFNPQSNFYLSLHVSYPNASDRILGFRQNPGGDIMLHGNCVTIGCIPITDEGIKEVYWLAVLARSSGQSHLPMEIFPARLTAIELDRLAAKNRDRPDTIAFWTNLKEGFDCFEKNHKPPSVKVDRGGRYVFAAERNEIN
jgi:murein L,D-transpeptidase YafK